MLEAALWGLVQGLTEFLPVSSSGHLVLVPELLDRQGPDLAVSAVLHLGTLAAVLVYYRADVGRMVRFRDDPNGRRMLGLVVIGTIPAAVAGVVFESAIDDLFENPTRVAYALLGTGAVLLAAQRIKVGQRTLSQGRRGDAIVVGLAQAGALVPGISRSGVTITAGLGTGLTRLEAVRFSFLLGIPAIFGSGLIEMIDLIREGGLEPEVWAGVLTAGVSGYVAIAFLIRLIGRSGLTPYGVYCVVAALASLILI